MIKISFEVNKPGLLSHRRRITDETTPGPSDSPLGLSTIQMITINYIHLHTYLFINLYLPGLLSHLLRDSKVASPSFVVI